MRTIPHLLHEHPFFAGLPAESIDLVSGCATNIRFRTGEYLFREGEPADTFYVVRHGRVAVEARTPTRSTVIDTTEAGEVLGWSWLVPPYRWTFDARAVDDVRAVRFDGACLRDNVRGRPRARVRLPPAGRPGHVGGPALGQAAPPRPLRPAVSPAMNTRGDPAPPS